MIIGGMCWLAQRRGVCPTLFWLRIKTIIGGRHDFKANDGVEVRWSGDDLRDVMPLYIMGASFIRCSLGDTTRV